MNWLQYSGIWVTLVCNPYHWRIGFNDIDTIWSGPNCKEYSFQILLISVRIVIDNGSW